jgi:phosphoserine phosphatase RsbU/P
VDNLSPRVLVVDDSPVDRLLLSAVLQKEGYSVISAGNGKEGFEKAQKEQPDIILMDVMMPDESGFETCMRLKKDVRTNVIPVIFLSALDALQSRVAGLSGGGVDYIIKPFEREEVLARIRIHLRIRRAFEALIENQKAQLQQLKVAQQAILIQPDELPEAKFGVYYRPMNAAGGDFYDVIHLGEGIDGYFTADVGGHDLGAAFLTSALKVLLRQNFNTLYTPVETMTLLNNVLRSVLSEGVVLSACCTLLNRRSNRLVFVSAGHPPLIQIKPDGSLVTISAEGDLLGAFDSPTFDSVEILVQKGDRLLFFSDGLIESNLGKVVTRQEGIKNLLDKTGSYRHLPLSEMTKNIATAICRPENKLLDDILLLGVEV